MYLYTHLHICIERLPRTCSTCIYIYICMYLYDIYIYIYVYICTYIIYIYILNIDSEGLEYEENRKIKK